MKKLFAAGLAAVVLAPFGHAALALFYDGTGNNLASGTVNLTFNSITHSTGGAGLLGIWQETYTGTNDTTDLSTWSNFQAYCLAPDMYVGNPDNPWRADVGNLITTVADATARNKIGWLAGIFYNKTTLQYNAALATDHAKIQVAMWQLQGATINSAPAGWDTALVGNTITLTAGVYNYNPLTLYAYDFYDSYEWDNTNDNGQDLITGSGTPDQGVPEPFTLAFAGLGLAAALRRRAKR